MVRLIASLSKNNPDDFLLGGTKYMLNEYIQPNLGGVPRNPVPAADAAIKKLCDGLKEAVEFEKSL